MLTYPTCVVMYANCAVRAVHAATYGILLVRRGANEGWRKRAQESDKEREREKESRRGEKTPKIRLTTSFSLSGEPAGQHLTKYVPPGTLLWLSAWRRRLLRLQRR